MYRKLILALSIFFLTLFVYLPRVNAQTHPCESSTNFAELITCYEGFHFSNDIWKCMLRTPSACKDAFGDQVDEKLEVWQPRPWNEERKNTYNTIMGLYDTKILDRDKPENQALLTITPTSTVTPLPSVTPTMTPTPVPNSISTYHESCKQIIDAGSDCGRNLDALYDCYSGKGPEDGVWSCVDTSGNKIERGVCKETFINIVKNNMISVIGNDCGETEYNIPGTSDIVSYGLLRTHFDSKLNTRETRLNITPGQGLLNPTIVITQAVTEDELIQDVVNDTDTDLIKEGWEVLNCGFANGVDQGKDACCTNTLVDIDPDFSQTDVVVDPAANCNAFAEFFGLCPFPDFSQMAKDKFTAYLDDNEIVPKLNEYTQQEGNIPLCLVGTPSDPGSTSCKCGYEAVTAICERYIGDPVQSALCVDCMKDNDNPDTKKFYTALGCIDTSFEGIITEVFTLGLGIAGMVALLCIIYASFLMQTSQGNPEAIQKAQESITSCISGLILIIFSIFILRVIGVNILRLPGFQEATGSIVSPTPIPSVNQPTAVVQQPTPVPTTFEASITAATTIYTGIGNSYTVPGGHNIQRIAAISADGRYLQVVLEATPDISPNNPSGYVLRSSVTYDASMSLAEFDAPSWLP